MKIKTTKENTGKRLDIFLTKKLSELSRSQIQKLIKNGLIFVNGASAIPHYKLKESDVIEIKKTEIKKTEKKVPSKAKPSEIKILEDADEYLVINKPAGLIVHGSEQIKEVSLVDYLLRKYPEIKEVGDDPQRPGIVHRLDKDVSGVMVIAKTQKAFENLKKQFKTRTVIKEYIGLVHDSIIRDNDAIDFPIERAAAGYKMAALPKIKDGEENTEGKPALTEFTVLKRFVNFTLLKINIKTGRTHQIRAHMAAYGNPIVGDSLYGRKFKVKNQKLGLDRIFLVAAKLSFKDTKKVKHKFEIELPKELKEFLKTIK